ncbi:unnamed protein product, partial [Meganyctiphanes norvegica]
VNFEVYKKMTRKKYFWILTIVLLCTANYFINLYRENINEFLPNLTTYKESFISWKNSSLDHQIISPTREYSFRLKQDHFNSKESIKLINISEGKTQQYESSKTSNKSDETIERITESFEKNKTINFLDATIERINKSGEQDEIINKSGEIFKQTNEMDEIIKEKNDDNFGIILDLDENLLPESDTKWPVVVMQNNGRTGNAMNSYAISVALKKEFGDNATIAVTREVYTKVAKMFDIQRLTMPIVEDSFPGRVSEMKMNERCPDKFKVANDYVAHIRPCIRNGITNFKTTQQKKVVPIGGYPNRMYMIGEYIDEIRSSFHIKPSLLNKAQLFLHKASEEHGSNIVFVGFHIRRTDYVGHSQKYNGVNVPGPKYYSDALAHYRLRFDKVLFVVASDDLSHAKDHLNKYKDVVFSDMKSAAEDMALLASCNHSIMTVGSFGWWSSFLAGGEVVYALLFNYTIPPFAHPEMMGPHGFEHFHGIPVI